MTSNECQACFKKFTTKFDKVEADEGLILCRDCHLGSKIEEKRSLNNSMLSSNKQTNRKCSSCFKVITDSKYQILEQKKVVCEGCLKKQDKYKRNGKNSKEKEDIRRESKDLSPYKDL